MKKRSDIWDSKGDIVDMYVNQLLSYKEIAQKFACSAQTICNIMKTTSVQPRILIAQQPQRYKGPDHPSWKGGRRRTMGGYISIWQPTHPNADKVGCVREHRLVMERQLGRWLLKSEKVHHINGIRDDNRLENLELLSSANHTLRHHLCNECSLKKEIRLLRWQMKEMLKQLQGNLL